MKKKSSSLNFLAPGIFAALALPLFVFGQTTSPRTIQVRQVDGQMQYSIGAPGQRPPVFRKLPDGRIVRVAEEDLPPVQNPQVAQPVQPTPQVTFDESPQPPEHIRVPAGESLFSGSGVESLTPAQMKEQFEQNPAPPSATAPIEVPAARISQASPQAQSETQPSPVPAQPPAAAQLPAVIEQPPAPAYAEVTMADGRVMRVDVKTGQRVQADDPDTLWSVTLPDGSTAAVDPSSLGKGEIRLMDGRVIPVMTAAQIEAERKRLERERPLFEDATPLNSEQPRGQGAQ